MERGALPGGVTAKRGFLSPLAAAVVAVTAVTVGVVLSRMETVSLPEFVTAKSGFLSPLKSSMLTDKGLLPVGKSTLAKVALVAPMGVVVLSRMETLLLPLFVTAKSG